AARKADVALTVNRVGSMLTGFFCAGPVTDYAGAKRSDTARYGRYFHAMLARGVFLAASQFDATFVSAAHTDADVEHAAAAAAADAGPAPPPTPGAPLAAERVVGCRDESAAWSWPRRAPPQPPAVARERRRSSRPRSGRTSRSSPGPQRTLQRSAASAQ